MPRKAALRSLWARRCQGRLKVDPLAPVENGPLSAFFPLSWARAWTAWRLRISQFGLFEASSVENEAL